MVCWESTEVVCRTGIPSAAPGKVLTLLGKCHMFRTDLCTLVIIPDSRNPVSDGGGHGWGRSVSGGGEKTCPTRLSGKPCQRIMWTSTN